MVEGEQKITQDVAYIFPGQGAQYVGMGKDLYDAYPVCKEIFDKANQILKFDLTKLCFEGPKEDLTITSNSQVAILTHSIAALKALETNPLPDLQYIPKFALGLSLGEYSALIASGCLSFEEGLRLVRKRGEFMDMAAKKNPGKMVSIIGMSVQDVEGLCKGIGSCEIANINCPGQVVVSGKATNIELLAGLAKDKGAKRAILLDVSGAFHSDLMTPAKDKLEKEIENVEFKAPIYPIISNVTAKPTQDPTEIKQNLIKQVNSRTLFEASIRYVMDQGIKTYIEAGPGTVLKGLLRKIDKSLQVINIEKAEHLKPLQQEPQA
ncbi:MAG: ACP S-malonyltransferase [Candidatus Omnitrophica bacterium]|nr:ACP S-malonyltransferase [Candidatus Omnitrophota bacterium]